MRAIVKQLHSYNSRTRKTVMDLLDIAYMSILLQLLGTIWSFHISHSDFLRVKKRRKSTSIASEVKARSLKTAVIRLSAVGNEGEIKFSTLTGTLPRPTGEYAKGIQ
jgi:hypothetical protein